MTFLTSVDVKRCQALDATSYRQRHRVDPMSLCGDIDAPSRSLPPL